MNTSRKCENCRERAVRTVILPRFEEEIDHDGRTYHLTLENFEVGQCGVCREIYLNEEANEKITGGLRIAAGLLMPAEIRQGRESLGLTQKHLSKLLGISESTLSRWETGAQIQQRCLDRTLRSFFAVPAMRSFYATFEPGLPQPAAIHAVAKSEFSSFKPS